MRGSTTVPTRPRTRLWTENTAAGRLRRPPSSPDSGRRKTGKLFDSPCESTIVTKAPARARQRGSRLAAIHPRELRTSAGDRTPVVGTVAHERGRPRAAVDGRQPPDHRRRQERAVRDVREVLGHPPEVIRRGHPVGVATIEALEVDRLGVRPERALAAKVHVTVEVAHHELAEPAVDRCAVPEPDEVRLRDRPPAAVDAEHRQDVVGVLDRLEVEKERREAQYPERRGREDRALQAVGGALAQDAAR